MWGGNKKLKPEICNLEAWIWEAGSGSGKLNLDLDQRTWIWEGGSERIDLGGWIWEAGSGRGDLHGCLMVSASILDNFCMDF